MKRSINFAGLFYFTSKDHRQHPNCMDASLLMHQTALELLKERSLERKYSIYLSKLMGRGQLKTTNLVRPKKTNPFLSSYI